jgi:hypothetical protein
MDRTVGSPFLGGSEGDGGSDRLGGSERAPRSPLRYSRSSSSIPGGGIEEGIERLASMVFPVTGHTSAPSS